MRSRKMSSEREKEFNEFEEVSQVSHPSQKTKVHAVVSSVSPMEKSKACSIFLTGN